MFKRSFRWWGLLIVLFLPVTPTYAEADPVQLAVSAPAVTLVVGDEAVLQILGAGHKVSASSSDAGVATAEISDGALKITAKRTGQATLTVRDGNATTTVHVSVAERADTSWTNKGRQGMAVLHRTENADIPGEIQRLS